MKKLLFLSLFIVNLAFGQSVTISPTSNASTQFLQIQKNGIGLEQRSINGIVGVGTYVDNSGGAFIQTNSAHSLNFATNGGGRQMTLTTNGYFGIGSNASPTAQLDVMRGAAPDGTAIFRGTTHASHFNYSSTEDTYIRGGINGSKVIINDVLGLGYVGIGTNNPQAKLHISQGALRIDALGGFGDVQLYANDAGTVTGVLPIAFSAYNSNNLAANIATGVETTFPFATEEYDLGGFYNNATHEFSAPTNGIYHFDAFVKFGAVSSTTSSAIYSLIFYIDNTPSSIDQPIFVGSFNTLNFSRDVKLNAGQKVKIRVIQTSGSTLQLLGGGSSKFTGRLAIRL